MKKEKETTYNFDFTEEQIETIKRALSYSGLENCANRNLYKYFCEARTGNRIEDINILKRYNINID